MEKAIGEFHALEEFMLGMDCTIQNVSIARRWIFMMEGEIRWLDDFCVRLQAV